MPDRGTSRPKLIGWLGLGVVALLIVTGACGGSGEEAGTPAAETAPPPAQPIGEPEQAPESEPEPPTEPEELTGEEQAWLVTMNDSVQPVGESLADLGEMLADPQTQVLLLLRDQDTVIRAAVHLAVLKNCSATVERDVPPPPTVRLQKAAIRGPMLEACRHFEITADKLARGLDETDEALLVESSTSMSKGGAIIERVTARLSALR